MAELPVLRAQDGSRGGAETGIVAGRSASAHAPRSCSHFSILDAIGIAEEHESCETW